jgi:sporulation integral membrane protein YlbJ
MSLFRRSTSYRLKPMPYFMALFACFMTISMVQYPKEAFDSAVMGLNLWWNVVFPALLPFFILSEILMGLGAVHFIGVLLEPLMRPLFNVPGVGAFALSMGLASGYPMDAVITCKFRKNKLCSAVEAERLLSFTNTADPLFMFGAVAVGMFAMPEIGAIIAIAHYLSSFLVGIIFRFYGRDRDQIPPIPSGRDKKNIIVRAFQALNAARREDNRDFSQLLGDAVKSSMNTILLIGGFIMLFSVFLRIISVVGWTNYLSAFFASVLQLIGYHVSLAPALVSGLFEIDLGAMVASQTDAPLIEKVAVTGAIIAWSGLSVHGQVASIVIESGIRMTPYMVGRFIHAILAGLISIFLMKSQLLSTLFVMPAAVYSYGQSGIWLIRMEQTCYQISILMGIFICLSFGFQLVKQLGKCIKK